MTQEQRTEVAGLAHELRNHFTVMQNALYLLRKRLPDADAVVSRPLDILDREVAAARALVEDVLELHRPPRVAVEEGDVATWVREAAEAAVIGRESVRLRVQEGEARARADPVLVARMVRNLVLNAIEAMGEGGGTIEVSVTREGGEVVTRIADSGPGLPRGEGAAVFAPFHTKKAGGTGLGLALVRAFAEAQGGTVEAANRPEGGTAFTIRLPGESAP